MLRAILITALATLAAVGAGAQAGPPSPPIQVFLVRDAETDTISFHNLATGITTNTQVSGLNYTIVDGEVMYLDRQDSRVMLLAPSGDTRPHPFVERPPDARRIDWAISPDGQTIAWTITTGEPGALATTTFVAGKDGTPPREVLRDGPRDSIRAQPVALSMEGGTLYMDYQPEGVGDFTPYSEYAGLFALLLGEADDGIRYLPGEPGCFCGGGFGGGVFVRLALSDDLSGFDVQATTLGTNVTQNIPAVARGGYTQGGDVLVSPDGTLAVYALAQVSEFGTPNQSVRTVFVLADVRAGTQRELTNPLFNYLRPIAWTEENSAVILVSATNNSTWKLNLESGRLEEIARARYIGTLYPAER